MSWRDWFNKTRAEAKAKADREANSKVSSMPTCTYCGGTEWYGGPSGGMAQNILCANPKCRHWFNFVGSPLNYFEDLKRVEPSDDERVKEKTEQKSAEETKRLARMEEGRKAFRDGLSVSSQIIDPTYGSEGERRQNLERFAGFIDAMAEMVRGTPR